MFNNVGSGKGGEFGDKKTQFFFLLIFSFLKKFRPYKTTIFHYLKFEFHPNYKLHACHYVFVNKVVLIFVKDLG